MMNLLLTQIMAILKQHGFDGEKVQADIAAALEDVKAMKESQDRCEALLVDMALELKGARMDRAAE